MAHTSQPTVSAIVPTYNRAHLTSWVIQSVLALTLVLAAMAPPPLANRVAACSLQHPPSLVTPSSTTPPTRLCSYEYRWSTHTKPSWREVKPNLFHGWCDVHFLNQGPGDAYNVKATITYIPNNVTVIDGVVNLGTILHGSGAWGADDFGLELDMSHPSDPRDGIQWQVEYDDAATGGNHYILRNVPTFCGDQATIGDFVWIDTNKNGIQDAGEAGAAGVTVNLYDNRNYLVATAVTNATGNFSFTAAPGEYQLEFVKPEGYLFTPKDVGGDDAKDSDADASTGRTQWIQTLKGTPPDLTWDCGLISSVPDITVTPLSINFGSVQVGSTSSSNFVTITNDGTANLIIGTITINNGQFSISSGNISGQTLPPAAKANITLVFTPASTGAQSATLSIPSNDPDENPVTVSLSGNGTVSPWSWPELPATPPEVIEKYFIVDFLGK